MNTSCLVLYDDGQGDFGPLTDLRAAGCLRTGARLTHERVAQVLARKIDRIALARPDLAELLCSHQLIPMYADAPCTNPALIVNARWLGVKQAEQVRNLALDAALVGPDGILAACLAPDDARAFLRTGALPGRVKVRDIEAGTLIRRPWHILDQLEQTLAYDLAHPAQSALDPVPASCHLFGAHGVNLANVHVQPGCVFNTEAGPIEVAAGAVLGAGSVLEGPCYVGEHTQLAAQTYLRPNTVIGPYCKVAGEISFSVIQGFSNKAHYGYLGHSLVGRWVNLGAGTTVSNLKNTYGSIRIQLHPDQPAEDTGRKFHGPIFGDFVRTAIGARILTGSCLNTGTMLAVSGHAPKCTRAFGFYTDDAPEGVPHDTDKFLATARMMMSRRQVEMSPALEARLRTLLARATADGTPAALD